MSQRRWAFKQTGWQKTNVSVDENVNHWDLVKAPGASGSWTVEGGGEGGGVHAGEKAAIHDDFQQNCVSHLLTTNYPAVIRQHCVLIWLSYSAALSCNSVALAWNKNSFSHSLYPTRGCRGLEPAGYMLDKSPVHHRAGTERQTTHTHTHIQTCERLTQVTQLMWTVGQTWRKSMQTLHKNNKLIDPLLPNNFIIIQK